MSLFSHPLEVRAKEQIQSRRALARSKAPSRFKMQGRPNPLTKELRLEMIITLKKLLAREKGQKSAENAANWASQYFATLEQYSLASPSFAIESLKPSAQVSQLFEKMVGSLIHIDQQGISETTLELNSSEFSSSIFYGATLTITEYSTAPKVFNIRLTASPEAVNVFQAHAGELAGAVNKGNYSFSLERIETELQDERAERPLPQNDQEGDHGRDR